MEKLSNGASDFHKCNYIIDETFILHALYISFFQRFSPLFFERVGGILANWTGMYYTEDFMVKYRFKHNLIQKHE